MWSRCPRVRTLSSHNIELTAASVVCWPVAMNPTAAAAPHTHSWRGHESEGMGSRKRPTSLRFPDTVRVSARLTAGQYPRGGTGRWLIESHQSGKHLRVISPVQTKEIVQQRLRQDVFNTST